jgi:hypothetical protein
MRHEFENFAYGREPTGNIELPQVEVPAIEDPSTEASQEG